MLSENIILDEAVKDALYEQEQRSQLEYARNEGGLEGRQEGSFQTLKDSLHRLIKKYIKKMPNG